MNYKKTILFFDRCDLTHLYILLTKELEGKVNIVHVAYSMEEADILDKAGINYDCIYLYEFAKRIDTTTINNEILKKIDTDIINYSEGSFNLNATIQSDRGYTVLSYEEALLSSQCHYQLWVEIFGKYKVDLMYHESCSLFFNYIAAILCKKQGGIYRYPVQIQSDRVGYSYINCNGDKLTCPEIEDKYLYFVEHPDMIDRLRCSKYIDNFRKDFSVFMGSITQKGISDLSLRIHGLKEKIINNINRKHIDRIRQNINYWLSCQNSQLDKLENLQQYRKKHIVFIAELPENEEYYYYSFHLEPEAVVLYSGDGLYNNQIKLIENIAASIPAGTYLYVKDHPHEFAYRKADDYERLLKIPNIRLIDRSISGKTLIAKAIGVFTLNGTAGYEGLLLGKQVFCYANNYYSFHPRVNYIHDVRDTRKVVYKAQNQNLADDDSLYAYVNAFLESAHEGFVNYFVGRADKLCKDQKANAHNIAMDILKELK